MEKKFLDESTLTYLRNYIDGQDKVIYKTAADLVSSTHLESLTRPATQPDAQVIPSITITNEQQNLTIGDGLEIKDGALTTKKYVEANPTDTGTTDLTSLKVNGEVFNIPSGSGSDSLSISDYRYIYNNDKGILKLNDGNIDYYLISHGLVCPENGFCKLFSVGWGLDYRFRFELNYPHREYIVPLDNGTFAMVSQLISIKDVKQLYKHEYTLTETSSSDTIKVCFWSTQNVKVALEDASRYAFSNIQAYDETTSISLTLLRINSDSFYVIGDSGTIESKAYSVTSYTIDGTTKTY